MDSWLELYEIIVSEYSILIDQSKLIATMHHEVIKDMDDKYRTCITPIVNALREVTENVTMIHEDMIENGIDHNKMEVMTRHMNVIKSLNAILHSELKIIQDGN